MSAFAEANRKAFNEIASTYLSQPWQVRLFEQVSQALQSRKDWLGVQWSNTHSQQKVKLLDYACGTGSISKSLGEYVSVMRGIDISEKMVEEYNRATTSAGLSHHQAHAVVGDLTAETVPNELSGPEWHDFDIAVVGLGFHHFDNPSLAIKRLTERLKAGSGVLVIVDFVVFKNELEAEQQARKENPDANLPDMTHTIKHSGFLEEDMRKFYEDAGLTDFRFDVLSEPAVLEMKSATRKRTIFIARGRRSN